MIIRIKSLVKMPLRFSTTLFKHPPSPPFFSALSEPPFIQIRTGGPKELFTGKGSVLNGIFEQLRAASAAVADTKGKPVEQVKIDIGVVY
jgi:hypothetical protein